MALSVTPSGAEEILRDFIEKEVAQKILVKKYNNQEKSVSYVNPTVYRSAVIPRNATDNSEFFPYICVRLEKIFHGTGLNTMIGDENRRSRGRFFQMRIDFGVYCPGVDEDLNQIDDGSGYADLWSMIEKAEEALFKQLIIGGKLSLVYRGFESGVVENSPYPYWLGYITVMFEVNQIEPEVWDSTFSFE